MNRRYLRLHDTLLWLLAGAVGLAENWLFGSCGLDTAQRTVVVSDFLPLMILLVLVCVFQQNALQRKKVSQGMIQ